jgi:hypothetical protein
MTLALGATLLLSGPAGATNNHGGNQGNQYKCNEYKQVYAQSEYTSYPHQHLDVVCKEGYRAISCEASIGGQHDYQYSKYFIALNEAHPAGFKKNHQGEYEHTSSNPTSYGCHFRANNFLEYFTPSYQTQYKNDFYWAIQGYATCVPKQCVEFKQTHDYYDDYVYPEDY